MSKLTTCVLITGTVGSGKTSTAYAIGRRLRDSLVPHAVIDLDELRRCWPAPPDDQFNTALEAENLRSVAANYRRAGAMRLVVAGVVEGAGALQRYSEALGFPVVLVRLRVDLCLVRERLVERHEPGEERDWYLNRSGQLDGILDEENAASITIDVSDEPLDRVAQRVLSAINWA
ncbi:AAA family ATPase [Curtobacterium sp. ISL-83]|uniref:AAA family ATPase n=1 Tax=Curtobacterium sp. ISL-83 TaxID=2819145 RepID=UPI001BE93384|nr:AAA family ATPase [Curtobacterium sp. ISL-83]MBT2501066.1 adenylyl-sulfate kinase [Curtobacterium sp. ISL-83]